jgi:uncharacterized protein (TIGR00369 family)
MDEKAARRAFEAALETHRPEFGRFFLSRLFGLEISYAEEVCIVEIDVKDFMFNPQGSLHGGVIAFALDVSMGHLIKRSIGRAGITLEMKTQYLRPAGVGRIRCEGRFLRKGRSIVSLESRMTNTEGKLAAVATSTWQMLPDKTTANSA